MSAHVQVERTARKPYRCEEAGPRGCRRTAAIEPGDRYVYCSGVYDGHPYSYRLCLRCSRAWTRAVARFKWDWEDDDAPALGGLTAYLWDTRDLRPWARERTVRERIRRLRAEGKHAIADQWEGLVTWFAPCRALVTWPRDKEVER